MSVFTAIIAPLLIIVAVGAEIVLVRTYLGFEETIQVRLTNALAIISGALVIMFGAGVGFLLLPITIQKADVPETLSIELGMFRSGTPSRGVDPPYSLLRTWVQGRVKGDSGSGSGWH